MADHPLEKSTKFRFSTGALVLAFAGAVLIGLPDRTNVPEPPPPPPPPQQSPDPEPVFVPQAPPPVIVVPPTPTFTPPVVVPSDVTNSNFDVNSSVESLLNTTSSMALAGIKEVKSFPRNDELTGSADFILVQGQQGSNFKKETPYTAKLESGALLVAVKKPSSIGMVQTDGLGEIALYANSDALVSYSDGILRVMNMDGTGENVRVSLNQGPFADDAKIYAISPGYELIASLKSIGRRDLRPGLDGIARRNARVLGNGHVAISEFSVQSFLQSSAIIAAMKQAETGSKERRIIADVSRMAAVLNYVNGAQGYTAEGQQ